MGAIKDIGEFLGGGVDAGQGAAGIKPGTRKETTAEHAQRLLVGAAALAAGISPTTLWGVYGTESGFGKNLGPSSAGAIGPFQFMPATARSEGLANPMDFKTSAYASARYLRKLGANSDPNSAATRKALNAYNGNRSGASESSYTQKVDRYGGTYGTTNNVLSPTAGQELAAATPGVHDLNSFLAKFAVIFDGAFWLRAGKILLGIICLVGGIIFIGREFAGGQVASIAKKAMSK